MADASKALAGKATVPEVKAYFAEGESGMALTAKDLIALKRAESAPENEAASYAGSDNATAYDDLAIGIGNGSLTY